MSNLEYEYIAGKLIADSAKDIIQKIKENEITVNILENVETILKDKNEAKVFQEDIKEGEAFKYRGYYVFKLNDIYTAFKTRKTKILDKEKELLAKTYEKTIANSFKNNKELEGKIVNYIINKPASSNTELNSFFAKHLSKYKDKLKEFGLSITKFNTLDLKDKLYFFDKITKIDLSDMEDYMKKEKMFYIRMSKETNLDLNSYIDKIENSDFKRDIKIINELNKILEEDFINNSMLVFKEAKAIVKSTENLLNEIKDDIKLEFNKNINEFLHLKPNYIIKYNLDETYAIKNEIFIKKFDKNKFIEEQGMDNTNRIIMFLDENPKKIKWEIEQQNEMVAKQIKKNEQKNRLKVKI